MVWISNLPFSDKSPSSLIDETPGERIYDRVPVGGSVFRKIRGVQRKPVFQVLQFKIVNQAAYCGWQS